MARCKECDQEMVEQVSCTVEQHKFPGGEVLDRIPYGQETQYGDNPDFPEHCGDCATPIGGYHHPGCDTDECPVCHGQALWCLCRSVVATGAARTHERSRPTRGRRP